jgi:GNAT superfamily N-acetyltransferase
MEREEITCREARFDDAGAIVEFQIRMARETEDVSLDRGTCERGVSAVFDDGSLGRYYVAERGGKVIGSLLITFEWSDWRARQVWWIQSVYVKSDERGRGVYGTLYRFIQQLARNDRGVAGIRLYVDRRNRAAQTVYERLGMNGEHYQVFEWMKPGES